MKCVYCKKHLIKTKSQNHPIIKYCSEKCMKKIWILKNPEKRRLSIKKYDFKNKDNPIMKAKRREWSRLWADRNKEWLKVRQSTYHKGYYLKNSKYIKNRVKLWYSNNKSQRNEYICNKLKNDRNFRIATRIRSRIRRSIILYSKIKQVYAWKYGINYSNIIEHLKPFPKDISKYHIDHIKPLCSFDLTNPKQIKIAFAPENHQWLLAEDNLRKGKS